MPHPHKTDTTTKQVDQPFTPPPSWAFPYKKQQNNIIKLSKNRPKNTQII